MQIALILGYQKSVDLHTFHRFLATHSLPVVTGKLSAKLPVARYFGRRTVGRLWADRFLVPQYEGRR